MKRKRVVLADGNEAYMDSILFHILQAYRNLVELEIFTNRQDFENYLQQPHRIDLLIVDEQMYTRRILLQNVPTLIVLSENPEADYGSATILSKYSQLPRILDTIGLGLKKPGSQKETRILCVSSAAGGSGKTTLALGLAEILSARNYRTLFISTELAQSFAAFLNNPQAITPLVLDQAGMDASRFSSECLGYEGFYYLRPLSASLESYMYDKNLYARLLKRLGREKAFDFIVIDLENGLDERNAQILSFADQLIVPLDDSPLGRFKVRRMMEQMVLDPAQGLVTVLNLARDAHSLEDQSLHVDHVIFEQDLSSLERMRQSLQLQSLAALVE